jgi:exopolysaccharide biosynthesis polyprenyl glycosylphosphotransferase
VTDGNGDGLAGASRVGPTLGASDVALQPGVVPRVPARRFERTPKAPAPGADRERDTALPPVGIRPLPRRAADASDGDVYLREGERRRESLGRDALHRRLLAGADSLAAAAAVAIAIAAAGARPGPAVLAVLPLVVGLSKVVGLYDRDEHVLHKTTLDETPALLTVAMAFTLGVWLLDGLLARPGLEKPHVLLTGCALVAAMGVARTVARRVALRLAPAERLLVLGSDEESQRIAGKLAMVHPLRAEVVGRVPLEREHRTEHGDRVLGVLPDLDYVLARHRIDRVLICPHGDGSGDMLDTIRIVKAFGVKVSVQPRLFEVIGSSVEFDELCGQILLGVRRYDLTKSSAALKRALDLVGALGALVLLAPLLVVIALAIRLTSSGPVLFRQLRVGRRGEQFHMLKFRTMHDGADGLKASLLHRNEADGLFKIADDPRVTPVGRLLRRTSLDELPQFINVLRGEMSLVGPRPLVREEDDRIEGWFRRRLDVTPGMTGAWQVLGSARTPLADMVTIDYLYRANWSLWMDIKILLRTIPHVLRRQGL